MGLASAESSSEVFALRFLDGLAEALADFALELFLAESPFKLLAAGCFGVLAEALARLGVGLVSAKSSPKALAVALRFLGVIMQLEAACEDLVINGRDENPESVDYMIVKSSNSQETTSNSNG